MTGGKNVLATGQLHVEEGVLSYESGEDRFRLRLDDVVLFGEYTTADGPGADDYFLVFIMRDGSRHDASFYSEGRDATIAALRNYWGVPLSLGLSASTSLASRIVWPASQSGRALFEFRRLPATNLIGRLRDRIGFASFEQRFSSAAQQLLGVTETVFTATLDEAREELDRNPGRALEITERAVRLSAGIDGDDVTRLRLQGRAWKEHGNALYMTGRYAEASDAAGRAQTIFGGHAVLAAERAAATQLMALVANALGDNEKALALLDECLAVFDIDRVPSKKLTALEIRGMVLIRLQRYEEALQTLHTARTEAEQLDAQAEIARIDLNSANCLIELGRLAEARRCVERAEKSFTALRMESEILRARWAMSSIIKREGRRREALLELERLRPEFAQRGMDGDAAELDQEIAELKRVA